MKILAILLFSLLSVFISCKQRKKNEDIFKDVPIANTENIDSIEHKIWLDAGENFTGHPTLKKNEYYYDERNFRDSIGNLKEYSIIECLGDTIDIHTNYFYYKNQLISVNRQAVGKNKFEITRYIFRDNKLVDTETEGQTVSLIPGDTLLNRGERYLSIKEDVGDKEFRKYFGKKLHPPNSTLEIVQ